MSVNAELLCSFELLKPLDSSALKSHIKKGRNKRQHMLNSPVSTPDLVNAEPALTETARERLPPECIVKPTQMSYKLTGVFTHIMARHMTVLCRCDGYSRAMFG
jgi:hypothetical protein